MEQLSNIMEMLNLMMHPAFCVRDGVIVGINPEAAGCMFSEGLSIRDLLVTGHEEYREFSGGCLYLTLSLSEQTWGASVTRIDGVDIFLLDNDPDQGQLQTLALAAQELREPLSSIMTVTDRLFSSVDGDDPQLQNQIARVNRGLFHMLRLVSNMSDACRYAREPLNHSEMRDITAVLQEIFQKSAELVRHADITLEFTNLQDSLFCLIDQDKLERSILNLISNAVKFTPAGGRINAQASIRGKKLYLQISDTGSGIPDNLRSSIFSRYMRSPSVEDGRHGIGLGMVLVRSVAAQHGGTVLVEQPESGGTKVTMTIALQQDRSGGVRSRVLRVDYAGERDHGLIELADTLPHTLYRKESIN